MGDDDRFWFDEASEVPKKVIDKLAANHVHHWDKKMFEAISAGSTVSEVTDPEDVLWICPRSEDLAGWPDFEGEPLSQRSPCLTCPCAEPHFKEECCPDDDRCPGCEPMDQFKAEEALLYISDNMFDWWDNNSSHMHDALAYTTTTTMEGFKDGK